MVNNLESWLINYSDFRYHQSLKRVNVGNIIYYFLEPKYLFYVLSHFRTIEEIINIVRTAKISFNFDYIVFVVLNDKKNVEFLSSYWHIISSKDFIKIIFVNLNKNTKWEIVPYIHNIIADKKNLKKGLLSFYTAIL